MLKDLQQRHVPAAVATTTRALFELLDGTHVAGRADRARRAALRRRPAPARLARLLADLGERGFLAGVEGPSAPAAEAPPSRLARLFKPREKIFPGVGARIEALYRRGGWVLFTRPALIASRR